MPEINEWGLLNEPFRLTGPCFLNSTGDEQYESDELIVKIHRRGKIEMWIVDEIQSINWKIAD